MSLLLIQDTVQQVAKAITAAVELETEIVDEKLMIIGGTGRYEKKIGSYEEDGKLDSNLIYATCLKNGVEYITFDPKKDPYYDARENELAEICCPIKIENRILGLIGLIAFSPEQRELIINKTRDFTVFLKIMGELIAGKYVLSQQNIHLQNTLSSLISTSAENTSFDTIISASSKMEEIKTRAMQVAQSNSTILITGESGTGKDLLARSIHNESPRSKEPFISINCAAIPETLLESELFGYEKGAFTGASQNGKIGKFQLADKGTIFLDEVGDMPLHLQVKLLTALQSRKIDPIGSTKSVDIDVRVIAATNKNLEEMIAANQFREDLYFRLNVIPLYIPPLRERPEDIEVLIHYAIKKFSSILGKSVTGITDNAMQALLTYSWPGNVREIENAIEYAINMERDSVIHETSLPEKIFSKTGKVIVRTGTFKEQMAACEKEILTACLESTGSSLEGKRKAAALLGISESTLYRRLRQLDLL